MNIQRYVQVLARIEEICKVEGPQKRAELERLKTRPDSFVDIPKKDAELKKLRKECADLCAEAASMNPRRFRGFWNGLLRDIRTIEEGRARDREMYERMWREPFKGKGRWKFISPR
jgi:hypothetical protein